MKKYRRAGIFYLPTGEETAEDWDDIEIVREVGPTKEELWEEAEHSAKSNMQNWAEDFAQCEDWGDFEFPLLEAIANWAAEDKEWLSPQIKSFWDRRATQ